MMQIPYQLILITNRRETPLADYLDFIRICALSGITALQLREKNASPAFLFNFGCKLKEILTPLGIPLILNDTISLAEHLDADGVHLGQTDGDPQMARAILGINKIIGLSVETPEKAFQTYQFPVNYIAASAVFSTVNKPDIRTIWGLDGLSNLVKQTSHPVVAIGGIHQGNAQQVLAAGASGLAVIKAIHAAVNPAEATRDLRRIIDSHFRGVRNDV